MPSDAADTSGKLPPLPDASTRPAAGLLGGIGGYAMQPPQPAAAPIAPISLPPLRPADAATMPINYWDALTGKDSAPPALPPLQPAAAPLVQSSMPAAAAAPPSAAVAPPDAAAMHAAPPSADELAEHGAAVAQAYQRNAANIDHAARLESKAIDVNAALQQKAAAEQLRVQGEFLRDQSQLQAQQAEQRKFFSQRQDAAAKAVDDASAAAASTPFDANRYVKSMNGGETALTALSIIFGGIGQAFGGGPNVGLALLNRRIEADVETQRMDYEKARGRIAAKQNAYAMLRDQGMTDEQARMGATAALNSRLQSQLALLGAQYAGPQADATRQMLQAHLENNRVQAQGKALENVLDESHKQWAERTQQATLDGKLTGGAPRLDQADVHQKEMEQLTIPGLGGHAKTPEEHQKAVLVEQTYRKMIPLLDEMRQMRQQHGRNLFPYDAETSARAANIANSVHLLGKDLFQLGVLSDSDNELLNKVFPANPLATFKLDNSVYGQIDQFKKNAGEARRSALQAWGFEIPRPGHDVLDAPPGERLAR